MGLSNIYEAVLFIVIISAVAVTSKEQLSTRECEDLGFTGLALCSDCNTFAEYVKDQGHPFPFLFSNFHFFPLLFYFIFSFVIAFTVNFTFFFCWFLVIFWGFTYLDCCDVFGLEFEFRVFVIGLVVEPRWGFQSGLEDYVFLVKVTDFFFFFCNFFCVILT